MGSSRTLDHLSSLSHERWVCELASFLRPLSLYLQNVLTEVLLERLARFLRRSRHVSSPTRPMIESVLRLLWDLGDCRTATTLLLHILQISESAPVSYLCDLVRDWELIFVNQGRIVDVIAVLHDISQQHEKVGGGSNPAIYSCSILLAYLLHSYRYISFLVIPKGIH